MQPITAWAGLIAEAQATPRFAQPRRQLRQNLGTVLENPELADLAAAATLRNRHSDRRLVHIQPDISDSIHQARLPCMRLCVGHPAQPSTFCMPRGGPPITQRTSGLNLVPKSERTQSLQNQSTQSPERAVLDTRQQITCCHELRAKLYVRSGFVAYRIDRHQPLADRIGCRTAFNGLREFHL